MGTDKRMPGIRETYIISRKSENGFKSRWGWSDQDGEDNFEREKVKVTGMEKTLWRMRKWKWPKWRRQYRGYEIFGQRENYLYQQALALNLLREVMWKKQCWLSITGFSSWSIIVNSWCKIPHYKDPPIRPSGWKRKRRRYCGMERTDKVEQSSSGGIIVEWIYRYSISSISHLFFLNPSMWEFWCFICTGLSSFWKLLSLHWYFSSSLVSAPLYRLCEHLVDCHLFSGNLLLRLALPPPGLVGPDREINFQNATQLQKFSFHLPKGWEEDQG